MKAEDAEKIYRLTQDAVRLADTKAGILLAVDAALLGLAGARWKEIFTAVGGMESAAEIVPLVTMLVMVLGLGISMFHLLASVRPRLNLSRSSSLVYFAHIDKNYRGNPDGFYRRLAEIDEQGLLREYTDQILAISQLCTRKYIHSASALKWLGVGLVSWVVLTVTLACGSCGR